MYKRIIAIVMMVLAFTFLVSCSAEEQDNNDEKEVSELVPVEIEAAKIGVIEEYKDYSSRIKASKEIRLVPTMPGKVEKVNVKTGETVTKDQVLIKLDDTSVDQQIDQAKSAYNTAKASTDLQLSRLNDLKSQKKELENASKELQDAIAEIDNGIDEVGNLIAQLQQSYDSGILTEDDYNTQIQTLNTQKSELETQKSSLNSQRTEIEEAKIGIEQTIKSLPYDTNTLNAQLNQAKTGLNSATQMLDSLELKSPINGVVSSVTVVEGDIASQTLPPITVIDIGKLFIDISVNEFDITKIEEGSSVSVYVKAMDKSYQAKVEYISPSKDQRIMGYLVRVSIDNKEKKLLPGMFGEVRFLFNKSSNAVLVPKRSIIREGKKSYLFILDDNKVKKIQVKTGLHNEEYVEIKQGIKDGLSIITKGQAYLKNGDNVKVVEGDKK